MKESRVPGTYKSNATTLDTQRTPYKQTGVIENDNYRPVTYKDMALADVRVKDEDYYYTKPELPGRIMGSPEMSKDEAKHKIHPPLTR